MSMSPTTTDGALIGVWVKRRPIRHRESCCRCGIVGLSLNSCWVVCTMSIEWPLDPLRIGLLRPSTPAVGQLLPSTLPDQSLNLAES